MNRKKVGGSALLLATAGILVAMCVGCAARKPQPVEAQASAYVNSCWEG